MTAHIEALSCPLLGKARSEDLRVASRKKPILLSLIYVQRYIQYGVLIKIYNCLKNVRISTKAFVQPELFSTKAIVQT